MLLVLAMTACWQPPRGPLPASFTEAEVVPARPFDRAHPMADVRWVLNYDVGQFDALWAWLNHEVPELQNIIRAVLNELDFIEQPLLSQPVLCQPQRQRRAINGHRVTELWQHK